TPFAAARPDLSALEDAARSIAPHLQAGTLVVLESSTYPGTTEQVVRPLLEAHGLKAGKDFLLAYSPERINPGDDKYGIADIPRVVGGLTPDSTEAAATFYGLIGHRWHPGSRPRAAAPAKQL